MTLVTRLLDLIDTEGPLPFEEFQRIALYDPDAGFFSTGGLRSTKSGDFLTSPEVSPLFGETVGTFLARELAEMGVHAPTIVEVGAGSGSLLGPMASPLPGAEVWAVEVSPAARDALETIAPGRVVAGLSDTPFGFAGAVVANELLDNLPVALARRRGKGWRELRVGRNGERLALVEHDARPEVAAWADAYGVDTPEGGMVEVQLEGDRWIEAALQRLDRGLLLLFDYGDTAEGLVPRRSQGTLRTYRAHHLGPDPLLEPGATDITVDVNFSAAEAAAWRGGATAVDVVRQDTFLTDAGLRTRLSDLRHRELDLAAGGDAMERLAVRSRRTEVETLLHPRGLGDFRVLIAHKEPESG